VDDANRLDLPQRRFLGIVEARLAGRIDAALEYRVIGPGAVGAHRGDARIVDGLLAQRINEAVPVVVAQVDKFAERDLAVRFGEPRIAFRVQALGALVVDHLVGFDGGTVVINLDVADRGNLLVIVVVFDFVRLNQHLGIGVGWLLGKPGGRRPRPQLVLKS